jgi:hypothetical protein
MSDPSQTPQAEDGGGIQAEIQKVASLITTARRMLADSKLVDLSALEGKVSALSEAVQRTPVESPETIRAAIDGILADLDRLDGELTAQFETDVNPSGNPGGDHTKQR